MRQILNISHPIYKPGDRVLFTSRDGVTLGTIEYCTYDVANEQRKYHLTGWMSDYYEGDLEHYNPDESVIRYGFSLS